jgi:hypothetical protein
MWKVFVPCLVLLGFITGGRLQSQQADRIENWQVLSSDPILSVGHGSFFDAKGNDLDPNPELAIAALRYYIKTLTLLSEEKNRSDANALNQRLQALKPETPVEDILIHAVQVTRLTRTAKAKNATSISSKSNALLSHYLRFEKGQAVVQDKRGGKIRPEMVQQLLDLKLLETKQATLSSGKQYVEECRAAGVPIPPDWGSTQWVSQGQLARKFISQSLDADLNAFQGDKADGVCMALPRASGNSIKLLGVICMARKTNKTCFWDNQKNDLQFDISKGSSVPLSDFSGGADLEGGSGGVCTDCHAGENPFIVHPGDKMDLGAAISPSGWTQPFVHPNWPQNVGPTTVLDGITLASGERACTSCHTKPAGVPGLRFPRVSNELPGYCGIVLERAIAQTMPPTSPGSNAAYAKHIDALRKACQQDPPPGTVVNGGTNTDPVPGRSDTSGPTGTCTDPDKCPVGFCYWTTVHGPFWQRSSGDLKLADPAHRGSFLRIFVENGLWTWRAFKDDTGLTAQAPPGGVFECTVYKDIPAVTNPNTCFASPFQVVDLTGNTTVKQTNATVTGIASINVLSGFIGNVAQAPKDNLRVRETKTMVLLRQEHAVPVPTPLTLGPLTGESWTNGCSGWDPIQLVKNKFTNSDVLLLTAEKAPNARCFIKGITGAWSSSRDEGRVQPFAEIYKTASGDVRLRVSPRSDKDGVGAYASCFAVK